MGTRHLTCVIKDGAFKVAQYGQWDGYPEGQGATILRYLNEFDMDRFRQRIDQCQWLNQEKFDAAYKALELPEDGWMNMEQAEVYAKNFPLLTRDLGAEILLRIYEHAEDEPIEVRDHSSFAHDSLFCEWAYVVDLDRNMFQVYRGFNHDKSADAGAFANVPRNADAEIARPDNEYYSVALVAEYSFDDLPTIEVIVEDTRDPEDDDK